MNITSSRVNAFIGKIYFITKVEKVLQEGFSRRVLHAYRSTQHAVHIVIVSLNKTFEMETVIRLRLSELTEQTISRVKKILGSAAASNDPEINILLDLESTGKDSYFKKLDESISQLQRGEITSFTMEEFEAYAQKLSGE